MRLELQHWADTRTDPILPVRMVDLGDLLHDLALWEEQGQPVAQDEVAWLLERVAELPCLCHPLDKKAGKTCLGDDARIIRGRGG